MTEQARSKARRFPPIAAKKRELIVCEAINSQKKISGTVLLSHSQIYSTIAAGGLNYRVREGNVCDSSAMGAGKYSNEEKVSLCEIP